MDKQTEELFKKLDEMYYQEKKRIEKDFREEKLNFYKITEKFIEIEKEIKEAIRKNGKENLILNYEFYMNLHKKLFDEIYPDIAGKLRDINVVKREEILNGESAKYATSSELKKEGKKFLDDFENKILEMQQEQKKETFLKNTVELWRKHYFFEGNTRTTALFVEIFAMKYDLKVTLLDKDIRNFRNELVFAAENRNFEKLSHYFYTIGNIIYRNKEEKKKTLLEKIQTRREQEENRHYKGLKK